MVHMRAKVLGLLGEAGLSEEQFAAAAEGSGMDAGMALETLHGLVAEGAVYRSARGMHKVLGGLAGAKSEKDRVGLEAWLVHCPEIEPDSYIHLNIEGNSYKLRGFAGSRGYWGPEHASGAATTTEFRSHYGKCLQPDAHPVQQDPRSLNLDSVAGRSQWRQIVTQINRQRGIRPGEVE